MKLKIALPELVWGDATLLVYTVTRGGEVIADSTEFKVKHCVQNKVIIYLLSYLFAYEGQSHYQGQVHYLLFYAYQGQGNCYLMPVQVIIYYLIYVKTRVMMIIYLCSVSSRHGEEGILHLLRQIPYIFE